MKVGSNKNIHKAAVYRKKLLVIPPQPCRSHGATHLIKNSDELINPAQKMKFFINEFFSKCDQIRRKLRICSRLLKKSLMGNFIFCAVKREKLPQNSC